MCEIALEKLNEAISRKRLEESAERHHAEAMKQSRDTHKVGKDGLFWARIAGVAGVLALVIGAVSFFVQIYSSKIPLSTLEATSPVPSSVQKEAKLKSSEPAVSSSSATPSPTESATETPLETATPTETP